jgi:biotin carboxyl carrier protein
MGKSFNVLVDGMHGFTITEEEALLLDIIPTAANHFHILEKGRPYRAELLNSNWYAKTYTIKINNTPYQVRIGDDLDLLIREMGLETRSSKQINNLHAPMPGLVLDLKVAVGETVEKGQVLLVLEAMKMENSIRSPRAGTVKALPLKKGDVLDKGNLLVTFEE